jgi:hypothetical protein
MPEFNFDAKANANLIAEDGSESSPSGSQASEGEEVDGEKVVGKN